MRILISISLLFTLNACAAADAMRVPLSTEYPAGSEFMQIKLLGTVMIPAQTIDGESLSELSGLAWDEDESLLYAVSDKGTLFHLKPHFDDQQLLKNVTVTHGYPLRNKHGKKLKGKKDDSEGLDILNSNNGKRADTELLVSFEGKHRIKRYAPDGSRTGDVKLPPVLRKRSNYHSANRGLEAVTIHPEHGVLTIPEASLKNTNPQQPILYSTAGKQWQLPTRAFRGSSIVGLETLADGSILTLERIYNSIIEPVIIALQIIQLDKNCEVGKNISCTAKHIAILSSAEGWSVDNFEGLTHHQGQRFFMVSDNNDFWLQRTLLTYFEILPKTTTDQ